GDKSDSPGRRNEILELDPALSPKCFLFPPAPGSPRPPAHARRPISARASSSAVFFRSLSRFSGSFLPLATASSHLIRPFLRYILVGISNRPFSRVCPKSLSISRRCSSSLRLCTGRWFSRLPCEYWLICALTSQASLLRTSA